MKTLIRIIRNTVNRTKNKKEHNHFYNSSRSYDQDENTFLFI